MARIGILALTLALAHVSPLAFAAVAQTTFRLEETLGATWTGERVRFPLSNFQRAEAASGAALVVGEGEAVAFELLEDDRGAAIEFLADLPRFGEATYSLRRDIAPAASQLTVDERDGLIRVTGSKAGITLRTSIAGEEGPLVAIRSASGAWVGSSRLVSRSDQPVTYRAEVTHRGALAVAVTCRTTFASGLRWDVTFTISANDPAILIEERWSDWEHPEFHVDFADSLKATHIYFRSGAGANLGRVLNQPLAPPAGRIAHVLEPWLRWWMNERQGNWLAAHGEASPDALVVAALHPDKWITSEDVTAGRRVVPINVTSPAGGLLLEMPANGRSRSWLLASMPRSEAIDLALVGQRVAPPPQRSVIRHGVFPLERVRHLTDITGLAGSRRQRLMLTEADIARLGRLGPVPEPAVSRMMGLKLNEFNLADHIEAYLRSGDPAIGRRILDEAPRAMQAVVDAFLHQNEHVTIGFAPHHHRSIMYAMHLADFALADPSFDPGLKRRLLGQAAFLADLVSRPDFWAPELGFSANPNMTSIVAGYQGLLGCLLQGHPKAGLWLDAALKELFHKQMLGWSDANGGWLEAPHYALLSYDHMLGVGICARNAIGAEQLYHPRMRKIAEWFAKISTPPNSRFFGRRHLPPIGNSYMLEDTSNFGTLAHVWRDRDPAFSADMQWMHLALGAPTHGGVGDHFPLLGPYQKVLKDLALPAQQPAYGSELFPQTGAILRSHFGTDRETQLHMIAGGNHAHYDYDSGSIILWGKGRLISDDFGYYGRAPASDHSMVDSPSAEAIMRVNAFATTRVLDYVAGRSGQWARQIALIKDRDPIAPNYFVMRDELVAGRGGTWRLWLTATSIKIDGRVVHVSGSEDVDTDIFILTSPDTAPRQETITRTAAASGLGRRYPSTQTALVIDLPAGNAGVAVIIYPRLKSQTPPRVSVSDNGRIAHIESGYGSDTIFLGREKFSGKSDGISFGGTVGAVVRRGATRALVLGAAGKISDGTRELAADKAEDLFHDR